MRKLIFIIFIINVCSKAKDVEIIEDFSLDLEYSLGLVYLYLEKSHSKWRKRGVISFHQKGSNKNNKSLAKVTNNDLSQEENTLIIQECEKQGNYIIRVKAGKNYMISSIPAVIIKNLV